MPSGGGRNLGGERRFLPAKRAFRAENPLLTLAKKGPQASISFLQTSDFKALRWIFLPTSDALRR
jgi:hypothetical protein